MKKLFSLLGVFSVFCVASLAQTITVPEPEFIGQAVCLTSDSTGINLEKEYGSISTKMKGSSFIPYAGAFAGGVNVYLAIKGATSPNVVKSSDADLRIIIRVENNNEDPAGIIRVAKLEKKSSQRRVKFMESTLAGGTHSEESDSYLKYTAKKYGDGCYLITISNNQLEKGSEYCIVASELGAAGHTSQQPVATFSYE